MNRYLFALSLILFAVVLVLVGIANEQYKGKKKALAQVKTEQEAVYQAQYLNYQKDKEIEQIRQMVEKSGLCDIILTEGI